MSSTSSSPHRFLVFSAAIAIVVSGCSVTLEGPGNAGAPGDSLPPVSDSTTLPSTTEPPPSSTTTPPTTTPPTTTPPTTTPPTTTPPTTTVPAPPPPTTSTTTTTTAPPPPPPPTPTTTTTTTTTTTAPPPPKKTIQVEAFNIAGEGSFRIDGKRVAGTGDSAGGTGDEKISLVDISHLLGSNTSNVEFKYFKTICLGPDFTARVYVNGERVVNYTWEKGDGCNRTFRWKFNEDGRV